VAVLVLVHMLVLVVALHDRISFLPLQLLLSGTLRTAKGITSGCNVQ
jgi:hypothetical protein